MPSEVLFRRRTVYLSGAAVFGALAMLTTLTIPARIQPAFPILPFLRFDPSEIFSVMAFLIFGPIAGTLTATVHWILLATTTASPRGLLGPTAKFAAVLTMLLGFWIGSKFYEGLLSRTVRPWVALTTIFAFGALSRVLLMTAINYFIFTVIGPLLVGFDYLAFGQSALQKTLGLQLASPLDVLVYMLLFTAIFNAVHSVFSTAPSYAIMTPLVAKIPQIASGRPWMERYITKQ